MTVKIEDIRRIAYEIWLAEGKPHGRDEAHWHEAERRLGLSRKGVKANGAAKTPKPAKPAASRSAAKEAPAAVAAESTAKRKRGSAKKPS